MTGQMTGSGNSVRVVAATEAKARLAELLRAVEFGETVAITRRGRTVAHLSPPGDDRRSAERAAAERFRAWRARRTRVGMTTEEILDLIREGRRW